MDRDLLGIEQLPSAARLERAERLRDIVRATGAGQATHDFVASLVSRAAEQADDATLPAGLRQGLGDLIGSLSSTYFKSSMTADTPVRAKMPDAVGHG